MSPPHAAHDHNLWNCVQASTSTKRPKAIEEQFESLSEFVSVVVAWLEDMFGR